jgi:hypothetical protein
LSLGSAVSNVTGGTSLISSVLSTLSSFLVATPQSTIGYQPQIAPIALGTVAPVPIPNTIPTPANASNVLQGYNLTYNPLVFNYEGENTGTFESDITDNYVEQNFAAQDQIALKPVRITVQGFVGELNNTPGYSGSVNVVQSGFSATLSAASKLSLLAAYSPSLYPAALIAYNQAVFAYNNAAALVGAAVGAASSLLSVVAPGSVSPTGETVINGNTFGKASGQNLQQVMFQNFYGYWFNKILFTVQTPWAIFENMAIERFHSIQAADTNEITDFEVTFKQIRYASTSTNTAGAVNPANSVGQTAAQASVPTAQPSSSAMNTGGPTVSQATSQ